MANKSIKKPLAIFLMGPTASGKTAVAIELVKRFPVEIISVDSTQVYRGLNIGSAKPSAEELRIAPHRLLDICSPTEAYSVADFISDAHQQMELVVQEGKIPLLVGGTMLYFKALVQGLATLPHADARIRDEINQLAEKQGWPYIHQLLSKVDAVSAARLHPNDRQRLQRALEVHRITGVPLSAWHQQQMSDGRSEWGQTSFDNFSYNVLSIAVAPATRALLHERIAQRFKVMMKAGLLEEVRYFFEKDTALSEKPAFKAVGYRQCWDCLAGKISYDAMVEQAIAATRQLAKRQLTWLRKWPNLTWFDSDDEDLSERVSIMVSAMASTMANTMMSTMLADRLKSDVHDTTLEKPKRADEH